MSSCLCCKHHDICKFKETREKIDEALKDIDNIEKYIHIETSCDKFECNPITSITYNPSIISSDSSLIANSHI